MIHSSNSENLRQPFVPCIAEMDEENVALGKRLKLVSDNHLKENVHERPGQLGLRLTKNDSLLNLIHRRLSQQNSSSAPSIARGEIPEAVHPEKVKASNFSASLLRIGSWEHVSRREGDLVAKFYYAKHKLVWEVLDGTLKSKFEFQSSEIVALKATLPEDGPGTLEIVLVRPPLFFKETNPQPRKHTVWKATSDFTGGEASRYRRHFLQCPQGSLDVHFAKLIHHNPYLCALSKNPAIVVHNPYFDELQPSPPNNLKDFYETNTSENNNHCLFSAAPSAQIKSAFAEYVHPALDHMEKEGFSRSSDKRFIPPPIADIRCLEHDFGGDESSDFKSDGPHLTNLVDSSRPVETLEDLRSLLMNDFHPTCAAEKRLLLSKMSSLWRLCEGLDDLDGNRSPVDDVREDGRPGSSPEPQAAEPSLNASPVLMRRLP